MPVMTSSCFVIMGCSRQTLADDIVNLKLALQSPRGLSVTRSASLCQQAPRMESDMAIFSKLPCHWQSCSYLAIKQAIKLFWIASSGPERLPTSPFNRGAKAARPPHDIGWFIFLFIRLLICLSAWLSPGERGLQSLRKGPRSDSAVMGKFDPGLPHQLTAGSYVRFINILIYSTLQEAAAEY